MSEAVTEQQPDAAAESATESVVTPTATDASTDPKPTETVDFWKAKAREQEKRAKENAEAAKRLAEFEESQKTEAQKIAERAAAAERARDEAIADGLRYKAAAMHGIDEDHFDLLGSGDEEAITGRAERIGSLLKLRTENEALRAEVEALKQGKPAPASARPTTALKPGATAERIDPSQDDSYPAHWLPQRQQ